jgi:hypothetical protein
MPLARWAFPKTISSSRTISKGFQPSPAAVFVDKGVTNTLLVGKKCNVQDGGIGTVIVKLGGKDK